MSKILMFYTINKSLDIIKTKFSNMKDLYDPL